MNRRPPNPHHFREEAVPYRGGGPAEPCRWRFIDLFCGCGGFTLGMQHAGFQCLAAIDSNAKTVATLKANLPETEHILERDLPRFAPAELAQVIGTDSVDVIFPGWFRFPETSTQVYRLIGNVVPPLVVEVIENPVFN
jgi:site-specific DNA-cytosine methylase